MKMDGRGSAEYQIWEKRDIMVILEIVLNDNKTKWEQWSSSPNIKSEQKRAEQGA